MERLVDVELHEGIAVLTLDAPPENALAPALRAALLAALKEAATAGAHAIVLAAAGRNFCADPGLGPLEDVHADPPLSELCDAIEALEVPLVAVLQGLVLGAGAELALAAHARVGQEGLRIALPGIGQGLVPEAGGSLRLPRLAGVETALEMLLGGQPLGGRAAAETGLLDRLVQGPALPGALALAKELAGQAPRPASEREDGIADPSAYLAAIAGARARLPRGAPHAARAIVDCLEAALILPWPAAAEMERAFRAECESAPEARGLRYAALAERAAWAGAGPARPQPLGRVAVVGAAGDALALALIAAGLNVDLVEVEQAPLDRAVLRIAERLERDCSAGRLSPEGRDARLARLNPGTGFEVLAGADLVIEAGEPDPELKRELLRVIGLTAREGAVIAAAGDLDPVRGLAQATGRPADTLALHLADAPGARLAAVSPAAGTRPEALAALLAALRRIGRQAVVGAGAPGRPLAVLGAALGRAVERLLLAGAGPVEIDAALLERGWAEGPCLMLDRAGLDRAADRMEAVEARGWGPGPLGILGALAETGALGEAAGRGLYAWQGGAPLGASREAAAITAERAGDAPGAADIAGRIEAALVAAAAGLVEQGALARLSDADVTALAGLGYPRARGGPLMGAELDGLIATRRRLKALSGEDGELWRVPPLLAGLVRNGSGVAAALG